MAFKQILLHLVAIASLTVSAYLKAESDFDHLVTGFPLEGEHATLECESCHIGGIYDELPTKCEDCHNGNLATGKSPDHIATGQSCGICHTPEGFAISGTTLFDHSNVGTACSACHNGVNATGKPSNHPNTTNYCEYCHTTNSWTPILLPLDHSQVLGGCGNAGCHDGSSSGRSKPISHPPTSNICETCHSISGWLVFQGVVDHSQFFATACLASGCHSIAEKPAFHPQVVTDNCEICHIGGSWTLFNLPFNHTLTTEPTCASAGCHSKSASHPLSSDQCQSCHQTTSWTDIITPFNHGLTSATCASSGCHAAGSVRTSKPLIHPLSSDLCEACHTTNNWVTLVLPFRHDQAVIASCVAQGCHSAAEKTAAHPLTSDVCELCHSAGLWTPVRRPFPHTQTTAQCVSCHNGTIATGKTALHPGTTDVCDTCHSVGTPFARPLPPFSHDGVTQVFCSSAGCHSALDKSPLHPATSDACETCHVNTSWATIIQNAHTYTTGCANAGCHTQSALHPATAFNCETCHSYPLWSNLNQPFNHLATTATCASSFCHNGQSARTYKSASHPNTTELCFLCHVTTSFTGTFVLPFGHDQTTATCVTCHNNVITGGKTANHPASSDVCNDCHTTTAWLPALAADHSLATNQINCGRAGCHDGAAATGKGQGHPTTTNTCEACHSFNNGWLQPLLPFDHTQVTGATCKEAGCHTTAQQGATHGNCGITDLDCSQCHNTSGWQNQAQSADCPTNTGGGGGGGGGGTNLAPTASITGPTTGFCNTAYTFSGSTSTDPENDPLTYEWTVNGVAVVPSPGVNLVQSFTVGGANTVGLVVSDLTQSSLPALPHTITISFGMGCGM